MSFIKGEKPRDLDAAKGGAKLGRSRDFLKESDGEDQRYGGTATYKNPDSDDENYGKAGAVTVNKGTGFKGVQTKRTGDKSLPAIKPRK